MGKFFVSIGSSAVALIFGCALAVPARAAVVYSYSTTGCFTSGCVDSTSAVTSATSSNGKSTYTLTFTGLSEAGIAAAGPNNSIDLGTLVLDHTGSTNAAAQFNSVPFTLNIDFTDPNAGGHSVTATVSGMLNTGSQFGTITFNGPTLITYAGGSLDFTVTTVSIPKNPGDSNELNGLEIVANITSDVRVAPVPEASTWAMMIVGFFGVSFVAYRNKGTLRLT
jgi:hypothetical protein